MGIHFSERSLLCQSDHFCVREIDFVSKRSLLCQRDQFCAGAITFVPARSLLCQKDRFCAREINFVPERSILCQREITFVSERLLLSQRDRFCIKVGSLKESQAPLHCIDQSLKCEPTIQSSSRCRASSENGHFSLLPVSHKKKQNKKTKQKTR